MNYKLIFGLFLIALVSLSFSYDLCPKPVWKEPICDYWIPINQICADTWGLDPYFVAAIVKKESDFKKITLCQISSVFQNILLLHLIWLLIQREL